MKQRELKFRAWNGIEMVYDVMVGKFGTFYVNPSNNGIDERDAACLTPFNTKYPEGTPVMQFTGLIDKERKEIYEGDILEFFEKPVATVVFESVGGWSYQWIDETYKRVRHQNPEPFFSNIELFKVIGNIYATPELLRDTRDKLTPH